MEAHISPQDPQSSKLTANNVAATQTIVPLTYTVAQAAAVLGMSEDTIYRLLKRRLLRPIPGIRHKLIYRNQVHQFAKGEEQND